jgi:hypothetical protein
VTDSERAEAFADFKHWGVRMGRCLDAGLNAVPPIRTS